MNIKLEYLYFDTVDAGYAHEDHEHPTYELVYYLTGSGLVTKDGVVKKFTSATFSFTTPNCLHKRHYHTDTNYLAIGFSLEASTAVPSNLYCDDDGTILSDLQLIKGEFLSRQPNYELMINSLITKILIHLERQTNVTKTEETSEDTMSYILKYIDTHYHEPLDFNKLADLAHYTPDYFRHKFKDITGHGPAHYVLLRRLESAKEMLRWSNHNISYIASTCGFSTTSHFCHMFKKYNNVTPLVFRRSIT